MSRRKAAWTDADQEMWDTIFRLTAPARDEAIRKGRRQLAAGSWPHCGYRRRIADD